MPESPDKFIERKILIAFISSTEFIKQIRELYSPKLMASSTAKRMSSWCVAHFDQYKKAPGAEIQSIYFEKVKKGLPKDIAEEIEEDILPGLNEEYLEGQEDLVYLIDQTKLYFSQKHIENHKEKVEALLAEGEIIAAELLLSSYKPLKLDSGVDILFSDLSSLNSVKIAFQEAADPLIKYPRHLGEFWNSQFVRGALVALLASEKRGKSFWLMDMATRAVRQGNKVAFFQAGDMTEAQQTKRFCVHIAKKSDQEKYCGKQFQPVRDCVRNQLDLCDKDERECDFGLFNKQKESELRYEVTKEQLLEVRDENPDYKPCCACDEYKHRHIGTAWLEEVNVGGPLQVKEALEQFENFFIKKKRQIMLSSHANGTLSINGIKAILGTWEKRDEFIPDVIIIDYADLLVPETKVEFRHQQNEIWKGLRNLSQEKRGGKLPLVISPTQADAKSYDSKLLRLSNFSEDKRKYSHVTAMYGLNQDPQGREKKIGIMRINELVIREGDFSNDNVCFVLQNLKRGLPYISSYF
jgi:hypothetical protein